MDGYEIQDSYFTFNLVSDDVHGGNSEQDVQGG